MISKTRAALVAGVALLLLSPVVAFAQDEAAVEKLVQLNKRAMDDLDTADFAAAKKSLLEAEKAGKRAGLDTHPIMARTYVHLGALYILGYKDKAKAQQYFGKAFDVQPDIKLDRSLNIGTVKDVFASVQSQKGSSAAETAAPAAPSSPAPESAPPLPARKPKRGGRAKSLLGDETADPNLPTDVVALDCPFPDETPPGRKVTLRCAAATTLGVAKVVLYYKGYEMGDYEEIGMEKTPKGWWRATIPKKHVDGKSLQFYFEGLSASAKPVVSNGRAESPNVMLLVEKREDVVQGKIGEEDENPLEEKSRFTPKLLLGKYDRSRLGVDPRYGNRRFWIGFGLGGGGALVFNRLPESWVNGYDNPTQSNLQPTSGFAWDMLGHLAPEVGVQFNPDWALAIQGRHQWIPQAPAVARYTSSGAHAVLLRLIRYTKQQRTRFYFAGNVGGGEGVRPVVYSDPMNMPKLRDTILIGPYLVGGSVGINVEIAKSVSWTAEVNALYGFPNAGINFDGNTAIQVNFGDTSKTSEQIEEEEKRKKESVAGSLNDDEEPQD